MTAAKKTMSEQCHNLKVKVDPVKKQMVITVPLEDYHFDKMVDLNTDINQYKLWNDGLKKVRKDGKVVMEKVDNPNFDAGSTQNGFVGLTMEGYEHIGFEMKTIIKRDPIMKERASRLESERQRTMAKEILAEQESKPVNNTPSAPMMSAEDMKLFQEFLQFKKMMEQAKAN